jgi:hypothetical protein
MGCEGGNWVYLAESRIQWRDLANMAMDLVLYVRQLSDSLNWGSRGREPYTS